MEKKPPYNPNNKTELPLNHYLELFRAGDPEEIAGRTGAAWDGEAFTLRICGEMSPAPVRASMYLRLPSISFCFAVFASNIF